MPPPNCHEQGYAVFRQGVDTGLLGHAGIFEGCESHDHSDQGVQWVWESLIDPAINGVQRNSFRSFKYYQCNKKGRTIRTKFWGIRTVSDGLTPVQQQRVLDSVIDVKGTRWNWFFSSHPGIGFRCDGLVAHAYKKAEVPGSWAWTFSPRRMFNRLSCIP